MRKISSFVCSITYIKIHSAHLELAFSIKKPSSTISVVKPKVLLALLKLQKQNCFQGSLD